MEINLSTPIFWLPCPLSAPKAWRCSRFWPNTCQGLRIEGKGRSTLVPPSDHNSVCIAGCSLSSWLPEERICVTSDKELHPCFLPLIIGGFYEAPSLPVLQIQRYCSAANARHLQSELWCATSHDSDTMAWLKLPIKTSWRRLFLRVGSYSLSRGSLKKRLETVCHAFPVS